MGLGHCCHSLNNYNPFNSSILFCVDLQVRTSVQCWFSSQCHHNFASSFALDNHFLSQELHISQCSTTQTHVEHPRTCTLSLGFPGSSLSSKCVLELLPWDLIFGVSTKCSGCGGQLMWSQQAQLPELQPKAPPPPPLLSLLSRPASDMILVYGFYMWTEPYWINKAISVWG